ncbi:SIR2 family protein [bacterium]|nr:SIR2 family protein [bacterium]
MRGLTEDVLGNLPKESEQVLEAIQNSFVPRNDRTTIEDYMSELVDWLSILGRRKLRDSENMAIGITSEKSFTIEQLEDALVEVKKKVTGAIDKSGLDLSTHRKFIDAVHRISHAGKSIAGSSTSYFIMNYDTLIEDALGLEKITVADGFSAGATAWWDLASYSNHDLQAKVYKLHGSIDWRQSSEGEFPHRPRKGVQASKTSEYGMIWPAATKYRESQSDPYALLMDAFRHALRPKGQADTVLLICGYSFSDAHINYEIDQALRQLEQKLTVIAFTELDVPDGQLADWVNDDEVNGLVKVYGNKGFYHDGEVKESDAELPWWKFEVLTDLLGGKR